MRVALSLRQISQKPFARRDPQFDVRAHPFSQRRRRKAPIDFAILVGHAIGVIRPESAPPHNLSRDVIEAYITDVGFQLWRMKK